MPETVPEPAVRSRLSDAVVASRAAGTVGVIVAGGVVVTGLVWLVRLAVAGESGGGGWMVGVVLTLSALALVGWGAWRRRRVWAAPMRELAELLPAVQRGEAPIDQLHQIGGGPRVLVPAIQNLLHELRSQQTAIAQLEAEMRQKVANRTDALERTINSLRQQATRDALTGLFNRRFLDQFLPQVIARHVSERKDLCLLMIDVDHFKVLNDTLGHAAGDDLLKAIGQLIRSAIRGQDVGCRLGGDEFVILLPESSADAGDALAARLASMVDSLAKTLRVPKPPRLAVGITTLNSSGCRTPGALLAVADQALYDVKKARRSLREGLNADGGGVQSPPWSRKVG